MLSRFNLIFYLQLSSSNMTLRLGITFFLLGLLLGPFIGHYAFLSAKKYVVGKTFQERFEKNGGKDRLHEFRFNRLELSQLNWEHDREFELNGVMYDVIEECEVYDTTILWCWLDQQETFLGVRIKKLFKRWTQGEDMDENSLAWQDWYKVKYVTNESDPVVRKIILYEDTVTLAEKRPQNFIIPPGPPPKIG